MGVEDEKLVYDYLSRVGDLAHGTSMSAAERAALVNRLRDEIGQRRAAAGGAESNREVRRILGRIGRPEDVVAAAADSPTAPSRGPASAPATPPRPVPAPRSERSDRAGRSREEDRRTADRGGSAEEPFDQLDQPLDQPLDLPPGRVEAPRVDTWRDGQVGRFFGGVIPELLRPESEEPDEDERAARRPRRRVPLDKDSDRDDGRGRGRDERYDDGDYDEYEYDDFDEAPREAEPAAAPTRPRPRPLRRIARQAFATGRVGGPFELLGVVLLVAGAVAGSIYPLGLGWALAYWSPRLSRREAQWATFGGPGLVAGGYGLWLFGRANGYWGEPLVEGAAGDALADHWGMLLRMAALTSAAFLLWRARRPRRDG
ncbi:hypothetical protein [Streptomyces sp. B6B3]|uniref:hypothetical protein n=1 Tax=Streptomyces sp. B6B3 TaxID=3153570 RepID=UPI00325D6D01